MTNNESDSEVKETLTAFPFDIPSSPSESTEDSNSPIEELIDLFDNTSVSESSVRDNYQVFTPSPWFTGGIMSAYISGGSGYSSSVNSGGHYCRGNGLTNLRDPSGNSGGSSSEGSPPLLYSPGIYQPQGVIGHSYLGQHTNGLGMGCSVQRSNSLPFELNGREVPPGLQGINHENQPMQPHENVYLGPVSHSGSIGSNGRIPPSIRLAMGINDVRRKQKVKYNFCVFCKNNGEDEKVYMGHTLKHDNGTIRCPILYNYECPLCGATGPVSHTIRYCPSSKGKQQVEEVASITQLKQMRSSTGRLRNISNNNTQIVGTPQPFQSSSSVAAARQFYNPQQQVAVCNSLAQGQPTTYPRPVLGQGHRNRDTTFLGPNAAWTGPTNQPCITPMYGEYVNSQNRQRCNYESLYQTAQKALTQGQCQSTQHQMSMPPQVTSQAQ